jgi:polyphosphate glucokinase
MTTTTNLPIGVDVGGTGIKVAPADLEHGALAAERSREETPHPATPDAIAEQVAKQVASFESQGSIGIALPAVVRRGVVETAANIHRSWIGTDAVALFSKATGRAVRVVNDADAAGVAEVAFGAGRDVDGVVVLVTLGTGIGTALFVDGSLVPNSELGHLRLRKHGEGELWAAESAREREGLSWHQWADRLTDYLQEMERLLWPDLFILGGGVSRQADKFVPLLGCSTRVVGAQLHNDAGIVGAAMFAPTGS